MNVYLALMLLFPLLGGAISALVGRVLPRRLVEVTACSAVWGSFVCALLTAFAYRHPEKIALGLWLSAFDLRLPITLYLDPLSLSLTVMVGFVCGVIHLYAVFYMEGDPGYARFYALLNLFVFAMLTLILAESLPLLYLGWEGVGFCSYLLIGFWYSDKNNADAGRKAFITTRIGDTALMIAIAWLFRLTGSFSIVALNAMPPPFPAGVVTTIGLLLLIGACGKSAQLPLMVWLPDAMAGPTPVSAMIHAATMVTAGVYLLARMFPLIGGSWTVTAAIAVTGALTAFYGASCALAQRDLKRVLAFSTISQIGYMMLGVGAGAITAATFHLLVHAFFKALLFLSAGCVISAMHHEQDIFKMGGVRHTHPLTFWSFLAGAACLAGLPGTGGFFSKEGILSALWLKGGALYLTLYAVALFTALLTSFYTFRMVYLVFCGKSQAKPQAGGQVQELLLIPLAVLALGGGALNLPSYLGGGYLDQFFAGLSQGRSAPPMTEFALQGGAAALAVAGLLAAHLRYGGKARARRIKESTAPASPLFSFLLNGWYFDRLYLTGLIRPYRSLAGFLWQYLDEGVIDDTLDLGGSALSFFGSVLGRWSCGRISIYLLSFASGVALLLAYLAWLSL
jgi:NADH-quinone oxidoreductase subunit L